MTSKRNFYIIAAVLLVLVLAINVLNGLYLLKESSREETWHEQAVTGADSVDRIEWRTVRSQSPLVEWTLTTPSRLTYLVQLLEDRRYVSAVFSGAADGTPRQYSKGRISKADSEAIFRNLEILYANRETLITTDDKASKNAVLNYSRNNASPATFRYSTKDFAYVANELREFDALLFAALSDSQIFAPRGYSRHQPQVDYSVDDLPALLRGLQSDSQAAYPSVIERMVAIGKPATTHLRKALRDGREQNYLPISRYIAVMNGLVELGDVHGEGSTLIEAIAREPASLPGRKKLQQHAQKIMAQIDTSAYIK